MLARILPTPAPASKADLGCSHCDIIGTAPTGDYSPKLPLSWRSASHTRGIDLVSVIMLENEIVN